MPIVSGHKAWQADQVQREPHRYDEDRLVGLHSFGRRGLFDEAGHEEGEEAPIVGTLDRVAKSVGEEHLRPSVDELHVVVAGE
jgi:hypothetical protein